MITVGIDPGLTGAVAMVGAVRAVFDMPVTEKGTGGVVKRHVDPAQLLALLFPRHDMRGGVELVASRPGQGVAGMFSLGDSFGVARTALTAFCSAVRIVTPQKWKAHFGLLGEPKEAALIVARHHFPDLAHMLTRKTKDIGRADALLIALYLEATW